MVDFCHQTVSESAALQILNSNTLFEEYLRVERSYAEFRGGMYWKAQGRYEYLVRTGLDNRQTRIGGRSPTTEQIYVDFVARKAALAKRLDSLSKALEEAQRLNKAVRAGRVPNLVVRLLNRLRSKGLDKDFTILGTYALFAYAATAGVNIMPRKTAVQDVDACWDVKRRVTFMTDLVDPPSRLILQILQHVDASFESKDRYFATAINSQGFEVAFLRRLRLGSLHSGLLSSEAGHEPIPVPLQNLLPDAARFSSPVIGLNGVMAMMNTISPTAFVALSRRLRNAEAAALLPENLHNIQQAEFVHKLLNDRCLPDQKTTSSEY